MAPARGVLAAGFCGLVWLAPIQPVAAQSGSFVDFATMSPTAPSVANRLCYTDGTDLACDGAAGLVMTSGTLQISGISATGRVSASNLYSSGNVGIGTSNPSSLLHVAGNAEFNAGSAFTNPFANGFDTPATDVLRISTAATEMRIQNKGGGGNGFISLYNNGAERLRIRADGNVGISTTSPNAKLDVYGTVSATNYVNTGTIDSWLNGVSNNSWIGASSNGWGQPHLHIGGYGTNPNRRIALFADETALFGNVGIGTYSPNAKLDVYGTVSATNFVGNGSGLTGIVATGTATDRISSTNNQSMVVATGAGTVSFTLGGTAGAAYLHPSLGLVASGVSTTGGISGTTGYFAGRVGIGTNSPHMQFQTTIVPSSGNSGLFISGTLNGEIAARFGAPGTVYTDFYCSTCASGSKIFRTGNTGNFTLESVNDTYTSATSILNATAAGNVGISTTNPNAKLDVYGTVSATNMKLATGNTCDASNYGMVQRNPVTNRLSICRPL